MSKQEVINNTTGEYGGKIEPSDIMYQDDLVCILYPHIKKGIIVYTNYTQPPGTPSLCEIGLKTGQQLQKEGIDFGRRIFHPYIFFKAPFYSTPIDYSTPEKELISSFGICNYKNKIFIRVDPDKTFTFSSEIRAKIWHEDPKYEGILMKSKKTLSDYLRIIYNNSQIEKKEKKNDKCLLWNLFSSEVSIHQLPQQPQLQNLELSLQPPQLQKLELSSQQKQLPKQLPQQLPQQLQKISQLQKIELSPLPANLAKLELLQLAKLELLQLQKLEKIKHLQKLTQLSFDEPKMIFQMTIKMPFDNNPINFNSEILVKIPHLTPNYFVKFE